MQRYASSVSQYFLAILSSHSSHVIFCVSNLMYLSQFSVLGLVYGKMNNVKRKDVFVGFVDDVLLNELL